MHMLCQSRSPVSCKLSLLLLTLVVLSATGSHGQEESKDIVETDPQAAAVREQQLIGRSRQLTFAGLRTGEGYFSADGSEIVFQSEREKDNPFYQIYLMDLETGDTERISPGHGKTTCAWIHPTKKQVLFASTHQDPESQKLQQKKLDERASGKESRYAWDYDKQFEIYSYDRAAKTYTQLTNAMGYDAEGSWSPDGKYIAFASNRSAYDGSMTADEKKKFDIDPAIMNEIYIMDADGSNVRRLTKTLGYDGGPFFSADGKKICWRRFSENGAIAEIMSMNVDGSDLRQLTQLKAMSWAPYFHPSGEYLIFTTNRHGFKNFELYLVDANGQSEPVRVTYTAGFDGLPVFTPDGNGIAWTTNRGGKSQIQMGDWNHQKALALLQGAKSKSSSPKLVASRGKFLPSDLARHVEFLCHPDLNGRLTGTPGAKKATEYVATYFESLGLEPAGDNGTWYQEFEFTAGAKTGPNNQLTTSDKNLQPKLNRDWRPLAFSATGEFAAAPIAFAGYGLSAAKEDNQDEYDSFVHLDVKDKWVMVFRYMPEDISAERRQHLSRHQNPRFKAMVARDKGARGLLIVSGPNSKVDEQLISMNFDRSGGTSIPVISISDALASKLLADSGKDLKKLQDKLDTGDMVMGFELKNAALSATIDIQTQRRTGRNVLGRLVAGKKPSENYVVVGAHVDHLGKGRNSSSLARDDERDGIHFGADDNASGVAAMLEVAEYLATQQQHNKLNAKRDIVFAAWSGEELGLIGSKHYVDSLPVLMHGHGHAAHSDPHAVNPHAVNPHAANPHSAKPHAANPHANDASKKTTKVKNPHAVDPHKANPHAANPHKTDPHAVDPHKTASQKSSKPAAHATGKSKSSHALAKPADPHAGMLNEHANQPRHHLVAACINMDMVGRMEKKLVLQGVGSSSIWREEIERRNAPVGLPLTLQNDSYIPTDAQVFFTSGVPILSAFTGSHSDYHTPRDTPNKLNYESAAQISRLMGLIARGLAKRDDVPDYIPQSGPKEKRRASLRAYLGTIPDYAEEDVKGVLLSGVSADAPAAKAGVKNGDIIVELAGKKIENIYDYTYAIEALKVNQPTTIVVQRKGKRITLEIVPGSRD